MLINSYRFGDVVVPEVQYRIPITVPDASIASTLTDFPVYVNLDDLPDTFFNHLMKDDGGDIRVKDANGVSIPFDLVWVSRTEKKGALWFKRTLTNGGSTVSYIYYGDSSLSLLPVNDTNGRNNVWSGYERVFLFGESFADRTGNGADLTSAIYPQTFENTSTSGNLGVHQGVAWDGTYYYVTGNNVLKKYDSSFTLVTSNNDPNGDVGFGVDHCGDPCVRDGVLYVPVEVYVNITTFSNQRIARFNTSDLSFIDSVSVSAQGHEVSSICFCSDDNNLYVSSYADGSKLWRYDPDTLAFVSSLSLSSTINFIQGVTYWRDTFWINAATADGSASGGGTYRVEFNGTVKGRVFDLDSGFYEGIDHTDSALLMLDDPGGPAGVVRILKPRQVAGGGGVDFTGNIDEHLLATGVTKFTTWTIGATVNVRAAGQNRVVVSYDVSGATSTADRATMAYRNASSTFGIWNVSDGWLINGSGASTGISYRLNTVQNATTNRKIYRDGGDLQTAAGATQKPSGSANALYIGAENANFSEDMDGSIGFVYLRNGELSADWIAAEYSNLSAPASFYTVGSEEAL